MAETSRHIACEQLGSIVFTSLRGDLLVVQACTPAPPGTRLTMRLGDGGEELVTGKVTSVVADRPILGRWEITIKLFAPARAAKELLGVDLMGSGERE